MPDIRGTPVEEFKREIKWQVKKLQEAEGEQGLVKLVFANLANNASRSARKPLVAVSDVGSYGPPVVSVLCSA